MEAPEVWWANYIAVKQELVETVLQDLPPASGAPDAGPDSAAAKAAWDAPCAAGWSAREARASGDAAGAGSALPYPTLPYPAIPNIVEGVAVAWEAQRASGWGPREARRQ